MRVVTRWYEWHDSLVYETWLIHMCDVIHLYVRHDSFICVTWLYHTCDMTHPYLVRYEPYVNESWHTYEWITSYISMSTCDMTHSYPFRYDVSCDMTRLHVRYEWVTSYISMSTCDMTHSYPFRYDVSCDMTRLHVRYESFICETWLIHIGLFSTMTITPIHSRKRLNLKYLHLQIGQFSCPLFWVTGTPVYSREILFEIWGTPVKTCLKVTGTPVKTCWNFGTRTYCMSDLLRLWKEMAHSDVRQNSFICATWLIHMWDMTHSYRALFWMTSTRVKRWRIQMCDRSCSYVQHDAFIFVAWLVQMWDMIHSYV